MQSSSDEEALASYYTSTFSVLWDGFAQPPENFPWVCINQQFSPFLCYNSHESYIYEQRAILDSIKDRLVNVLNAVDTLRVDAGTLKKPEPGSDHELFINQLKERIVGIIHIIIIIYND